MPVGRRDQHRRRCRRDRSAAGLRPDRPSQHPRRDPGLRADHPRLGPRPRRSPLERALGRLRPRRGRALPDLLAGGVDRLCGRRRGRARDAGRDARPARGPASAACHCCRAPGLRPAGRRVRAVDRRADQRGRTDRRGDAIHRGARRARRGRDPDLPRPAGPRGRAWHASAGDGRARSRVRCSSRLRTSSCSTSPPRPGSSARPATWSLLVAPWVALVRARTRWTPALVAASGVLAAVTTVGFLDHYTWTTPAGLIWVAIALGLWAAAYRAAASGGVDRA